jgi:hypothetical protein
MLLTVTSGLLALAGVAALFAPGAVYAIMGVPEANPSPSAALVAQMLGALYFGFALVNWIARESRIGGVYGRPITLGNFAHFTIGALTLARPVLAAGASAAAIVVLVVYAALAVAFGWLLFVATGLPPKTPPSP